MDDFSSSDRGLDLPRLADAFMTYQSVIFRNEREERTQLEGSDLEDEWADILSIFAGGAPEAPALLSLIVDRVPEELLSQHVGHLLIAMWLRSSDKSALPWLLDAARTNRKVRLAMEFVDLE